jgi:hypothetical protein
MVDTGHCGGGPQWEDLTARALAVPPPYRPIPGAPVYHVGLDDGTVVLVAEHDLCGSLLDLVTAVLAMGDAVLTRSPGFANRSGSPPQAHILSHRLAGRHRTQMPVPDTCWTLTCGYGFRRTRRTLGTDLRICDGSSCPPLARGGRFPRPGPRGLPARAPDRLAVLTMFIEELCGMLVHLGPAGAIRI